MAPASSPDDVLYEGPHASLPKRVVVSLGTGASLVGLVLFLQWGLAPSFASRPSPLVLATGALVAIGMIVAAFLSRTVYRVELKEGALVLWRDPGVAERFPLTSLAKVESVAPVGGWSRDPSERLVLHLTSGETLRFALLDDADTPGIVGDVVKAMQPDAVTNSV